MTLAFWVFSGCGCFSASANASSGYAVFTPQTIAHLKVQKSYNPDPEVKKFFAAVFKAAKEAINRKPMAKAELVIEGHPESKDGVLINDDMLILNWLATDYQLNRHHNSLEAAKRYLLAWAQIYQPSGNPINEEVFFKYIGAYELVMADLDESSRQIIDNFLRVLFEKEKQFINARVGFVAYSNWESRHLGLVTAIAYNLKDAGMMEYCSKKYLELLEQNILPAGILGELVPEAKTVSALKQRSTEYIEKGTSRDFLQRDAVEYHVANTVGLLLTAIVAHNQHLAWEKIQASRGQSLFDALDFTIPYALGVKTHQEFARTIVSYDREHHSGGAFDAKHAKMLLTLAAVLDSRYRKFANPAILRPFERLLYYAEANNGH